MLRRIRDRLYAPFQNGFVRNVGILTGGTVLGQAILVVALPFITRLYSPDDFSMLAVYMGLVAVFSTVACLRYNLAIPLPQDDADGMSILAISLATATAISILLVVPVLIAPGSVSRLLGQPELEPFLWMVPIGVLASSLYTGLQYWASRKKRFGIITRTRITRSAGGVGTQLGLGYTISGSIGLLIGQTVNNSLGVFALARSVWQNDRSTIREVRSGQILENLYVFRRYPIYSVPEALFNIAGLQVPILIIASLAIGPEAGFILLAMRVLGLPMSLIGGSVGQVYLAEAGQKMREGTFSSFTRKTIFTLAKVGAPPILIAGLISPFAFGPIFGDEWARAGVIVAWMTPWFVLQFIVSPVSTVLNVIDRQDLAVLLQIFGFATRVLAVLGAAQFAPNLLAEVFAVTSAVFYAVYAFVLLQVAATAQDQSGRLSDDPFR